MKNKLQANFEIIRLYDEGVLPPQVIKVGILPFVRQPEGIKIMAMKPLAENEVLGKPQFQIAKGTRRINISGEWCDMRLDDLHYADESFHETLLATALREGNEEIGLKQENIRSMFDLGGFTFISASKGIQKPMHLFAAEIIDTENFGHYEATTDEVRWFTEEEFVHHGRPDHVAIIRQVMQRLEKL
ncbi:MAG TPA: NUDIX hydrolase [Rickettsiales bacterium]|nr:NUDIX hydrolase [Rickettsiales bacterium]